MLFFKFLGRLLGFGFAVGCAMVAGLGLYAITLLPDLPTVEQIRQIPLNVPLRVYSADNKLIAEYGNERRIPVTLDEAPPLLLDAILATEDDNFYYHTGVDFPGLARAFLANIRSQSSGQGASTITMQVVRNFFLNPEKTYTRKLKEILLSFNMERALTKDEILELYLNKIFLGHRAYGFAAASQVYYGLELGDLSLPEIAMLAGLPKAPSRDNPISNPGRASERRDYVLRRLYTLEKIDELSYETAQRAPVTAERHVAEINAEAPYVAEMVRQYLVDRLGSHAYDRGLNVTVTIDSRYQTKANKALRDGLIAYDKRHGYRGAAGKINLDGLSNDKIDDLLLGYPSSQEVQPAVVLSAEQPGFTARTRNGDEVEVSLNTMTWAQPYKTPNSKGPEPVAADEVVAPGDVIYLYLQTGKAEDGQETTTWRFGQMPEVEGALVTIDSNSGAILALTGGFDYYLSKFNRATQAERQPGSNIKPFIYSAALDNGFTPASLVSGAPVVIEDDLEGVWRPENYSKKFFGPTRLRKALSKSLNLVSVRLLRAMGIDNTIQHLEKFGFDPERLPRSLALSLGATSITPIELVRGYAVFSNGGNLVTPYFIEKIEDNQGRPVNPEDLLLAACKNADDSDGTRDCGSPDEIEKAGIIEALDDGDADDTNGVRPPPIAAFRSEPRRVLSAQNAFLTANMMKQVIRSGTGTRALALERSDLSGKTGTTNNYLDAWFSGFNPEVTTTVFVGFDEPSHLGRRESGASAALPIWIDYMGTVLPDYPQLPEQPPEQIITRYIDNESGKLTATNDPNGFNEYFRAGTEPTNAVQPASRVSNATGRPAPTTDEQSVSESLF